MKQQKEEMKYWQANHNGYTWTSSLLPGKRHLHHELPILWSQL
jgi:hypothetical protein